jgi:hypothetical protein
MRRFCTLAILTAIVAMSAATAEAVYRRHVGYYGVYGYDSAIVIYDLGAAANARSYAAQSERLLGQKIAAQQMAAMQSGIRNAIELDGQRRTQNVILQQQADRDLWLQTQQQQSAQRKALAAQLALMKAAEADTAALDVIHWPAALRHPQFAEGRARIEAPYRRGSKAASTPTTEDYRVMIEAVGQMKTILKSTADDLSAREYLDAEAFLDRLAAEARSKLDKAAAKK